MAKYMINICYGDLQKRAEFFQSGQGPQLMQRYISWSREIAAKTVVSHKLRDQGGHILRVVNGQIKDGPFTETKESIGGFYVVEAANFDEAVKIARGCPSLEMQGATIEVREVEM